MFRIFDSFTAYQITNKRWNKIAYNKNGICQYKMAVVCTQDSDFQGSPYWQYCLYTTWKSRSPCQYLTELPSAFHRMKEEVPLRHKTPTLHPQCSPSFKRPFPKIYRIDRLRKKGRPSFFSSSSTYVQLSLLKRGKVNWRTNAVFFSFLSLRN